MAVPKITNGKRTARSARKLKEEMVSGQEEMSRYIEACNYPGVLDEKAVEFHLQRYLKALGVERKIERLAAGWNVYERPSLFRYANRVLDEFAKLSGGQPDRFVWRAARAAMDAMDAMAAMAARAAMDART